jgi:hypothetical protein
MHQFKMAADNVTMCICFMFLDSHRRRCRLHLHDCCVTISVAVFEQFLCTNFSTYNILPCLECCSHFYFDFELQFFSTNWFSVPNKKRLDRVLITTLVPDNDLVAVVFCICIPHVSDAGMDYGGVQCWRANIYWRSSAQTNANIVHYLCIYKFFFCTMHKVALNQFHFAIV